MEIVQRGDEKNEVICLVIMFTPRVMVIQMSQMTHFFAFSTDDSKKLVTLWAKYFNAPERSYQVLSENGTVRYHDHLWDTECKNTRKTAESLHLAHGSSEPNNQ